MMGHPIVVFFVNQKSLRDFHKCYNTVVYNARTKFFTFKVNTQIGLKDYICLATNHTQNILKAMTFIVKTKHFNLCHKS